MEKFIIFVSPIYDFKVSWERLFRVGKLNRPGDLVIEESLDKHLEESLSLVDEYKILLWPQTNESDAFNIF